MEDAKDLTDVLAIDATHRREIDIRALDPAESSVRLGISQGRLLCAKVFVSSAGTVASSGYLSRFGLHHNVEYADECDPRNWALGKQRQSETRCAKCTRIIAFMADRIPAARPIGFRSFSYQTNPLLNPEVRGQPNRAPNSVAH